MMTKTVNAQAIDSLKREAKVARRTDPTLSHAQHLNALAAHRFGVRNYHELLQQPDTAARPASAGTIIAMASTSLGSGKTSILLNLAAQLAARREDSRPYSVLLVDCDAWGPNPSPASVTQLLKNRANDAPALGFDVRFMPITAFLMQSDSLKRQFDYLLVDLGPDIGMTPLMNTVADVVLMPTRPLPRGQDDRVKWLLQAWTNEPATARLYMFGSRATSATGGQLMKRIHSLAQAARLAPSHVETLQLCFYEHNALTEASSRGELVAELAKPPQAFLDNMAQLAKICIVHSPRVSGQRS